MKKQEEEEFRDIPGFEGYQVSNLGRVKSFKREKEKLLKNSINFQGYYRVTLTNNKKTYTKSIHQLVARSFLNYFTDGTNKITIDHINNIKTDNRLENLQIISFRENISKDRKNGSSNYTGVHWCKRSKKWISKITINKKIVHLGIFSSEEQASNIYQKALNSVNNNEEIVLIKRETSSNYKGVTWHKEMSKWLSYIYINSKRKHIGYFNTELEAHNAYQNKLSEINSKLN